MVVITRGDAGMHEDLIRCFIAAELPADLLNEIGTYTGRLSGQTSGIRWVKPEGIHITLKFLGEITVSKVSAVKAQLGGIGGVADPFDLRISGSGCFPNRRQPRVIWLGLEHDPAHSLFKLHSWMDEQLEDLGFSREKRRFSPHLTLGRIKNLENPESLYAYLDQNPFPEKSFAVGEIFFKQSLLKPSGAVYKTLAGFPLGVQTLPL
jgi:2'-5' RNA ligase